MTSSEAPSSEAPIKVVVDESPSDETTSEMAPPPSNKQDKNKSRFAAVTSAMVNAKTAKSTADELQEDRLGKIVVDCGISKTSSLVSDTVDNQVSRKIFGVGEDGLNKAKVVFIALTGILSLAESSLIVTSCESTVLVDYSTLRDSVVMPMLESFAGISKGGSSVRGERGVAELASDFNATDWYPQCLGGPGLNRTGFHTADFLAPSAPPYGTVPQSPPSPPAPPYWTTYGAWPPSSPTMSESEIVGGVLSENALTNLWFADRDHTSCKADKLFQVSATTADCDEEDIACLDYVTDGVEGAGVHIKNMAYVYIYSMFLAAFAWTGARLALHYLTLRDSSLCSCCGAKCKKFWLLFLKKGGPVSLNALMIINTQIVWDEAIKAYGLALGQWDIIFAMSNVVLMSLAILTMLVLFCLPVCCACCASCATRGVRARRRASLDGSEKKKVRGPLDAVGTCGKWYLTLTLYVLSFEGLLITILSAFIHFFTENYSANGLELPETPQQIFESFPLVQMVMTWFMVPDDIDVALGSSIPEVRIVAIMRCVKVGTVAAPFVIDLALLVMGCKYDGPPACCKACAPGWCGQRAAAVEDSRLGTAEQPPSIEAVAASDEPAPQEAVAAGEAAPQEMVAAAGEVARQEVEYGAEYAVATSQQKLESLQTDVQQAVPADSREAIDDAQDQVAERLAEKEEEGEALDAVIVALRAAIAAKPGGARLEKLHAALEDARGAGVDEDPKHAALLEEGEAALKEEMSAAASAPLQEETVP